MVKSVGMREFRTHLSELIRELLRTGEEIIVTRRGREVARMLPPIGWNPSMYPEWERQNYRRRGDR